MIGALVDMAAGVWRWRTSLKLGLQDIELRYKRSFLGPFWISAALVATILALAFVFADIFRTEYVEYVSFIGTGLLAWQLVHGLINEACGSIAQHTSMLQNVRMPLTVIAGRIVIRDGIVFLHNVIAVVAVIVFLGAQWSWTMLYAAPGAVLILLFGYFMVLVLGPICTRFRDIPLVIQSVMQILFYMTPIFWTPDAIAHRPGLVAANPFYHLVELVRAPLLGELPTQLNWQVGLWCCAGAAVLSVVSVSLTRKRLNLWL